MENIFQKLFDNKFKKNKKYFYITAPNSISLAVSNYIDSIIYFPKLLFGN